MAKQQTLAMAEDQGSGFPRYAKPTRRDEFLSAVSASLMAAAPLRAAIPISPTKAASILNPANPTTKPTPI